MLCVDVMGGELQSKYFPDLFYFGGGWDGWDGCVVWQLGLGLLVCF